MLAPQRARVSARAARGHTAEPTRVDQCPLRHGSHVCAVGPQGRGEGGEGPTR